MPEHTPAEIAVLRERIDNTLQRLEHLAMEMKKDRDEFRLSVDALRAEIGRYKGFVGGVAFVFASVATAATLAKGWLFGEK
jgi:hypothetical protein